MNLTTDRFRYSSLNYNVSKANPGTVLSDEFLHPEIEKQQKIEISAVLILYEKIKPYRNIQARCCHPECQVSSTMAAQSGPWDPARK